MARRRTAKYIKIVQGGEPLPCPSCGMSNHRYLYKNIPCYWESECMECGLTNKVPGKPPPDPPKPPAPYNPQPFWPFGI